MTIDPDKLRAKHEQLLVKWMAELEPKRRSSTTANIRWARYNAQLERLRAKRGEPAADEQKDETE